MTSNQEVEQEISQVTTDDGKGDVMELWKTDGGMEKTDRGCIETCPMYPQTLRMLCFCVNQRSSSLTHYYMVRD